ncbi:hypothetical protein S245_044624, partial [Arachis hypogaea]
GYVRDCGEHRAVAREVSTAPSPCVEECTQLNAADLLSLLGKGERVWCIRCCRGESFSPNQKRKLKQEILASPPPPQGLPASVALKHYHRRLVVRASSFFKNRSFFFLELGALVPGIHLLHRAPAAVRRALNHHRLRLTWT